MKYLLYFLLSSATAAWGLDVGDTYQQVLSEKGKPKSQIDAGSLKILNYPDSTIKIRDNLVVSIKSVAPAPQNYTPPSQTTPKPQSVPASASALKLKMDDAVRKVQLIVNQPPVSVPRTPDMMAGYWGNGWFHPGATRPDFNNVDIRATQEFPYDKYPYVGSNLTPGLVFASKDLEFNSMTKYFYLDRSLPKKRLTESEMMEVNALYRIIGQCEAQLSQAPRS
jgi:hypothetical protein